MNLFNFIKQKISILDVVMHYSSLKKSGSYYKGRCPFHNEKTASFTVSPEKEIFYCFGCHTGGDVISFISKAENCSQFEAAKLLSEQYSIEIPSSITSKNEVNSQLRDNYINLCQLMAIWCHKNLLLNENAQKYLYSRSINNESINNFMIGYFPSGQSNIKKFLLYMQKENVLAADLIEAKILVNSNNNLYSPFEERIIFPLRNHMSKILGFGGRTFVSNDERAKYYNSHDNAYFNKGSLLFGFDQAKKEIQKKESVFLVEGYFDVIALVQNGYKNTVATLGTACTQEHLKMLARYAQKVYIVYDSDEAGRKAILRLTSLCWEENIDTYVINLPLSEDPASYLQKDNNFDDLIKKSQDIFSFFVGQTAINFEQKSLQEKLNLIKDLLKLISNVQDPLKKDLLLRKGSEVLKIPFETLKIKLYNQNYFKPTIQKKSTVDDIYYKEVVSKKENCDNPDNSQNSDFEKNKITQLEKKLFCAILNYSTEIKEEDHNLLKYWLPVPLNSIYKIIDRDLKINNKDFLNNLFDNLDDEEKNTISKIIIETDDKIKPDIEQLIFQFYKKQWKKIVQNIKEQVLQAQIEKNEEKITKLLKNLDILRKRIFQRIDK